ncbi:MAG: PAS domain-containing sensor histidine kinase [Cytophagaceae bacterium]|nr:PAS domain-containing sensor histidine kinase [Cytophagaceae bacterium]
MPIKANSLSELELRLQAIIDNAVDGIITIDTRGIIESANPAVNRIFGFTEDELVGKNISVLMPDPDRSRHNTYVDNYLKTGKANIIGKGRELIGKRKDGSTFPFLLSISEVHLNEKLIFTGIVHDLSEIRQMKAALEKEKELNELKSRFVTMASHEFRTPLSTILSSASLIAKYVSEKDQDKRDKHINRIKSSVSNLTGILNDFLSLSRLEEGQIHNHPSELELENLLDEIQEEMVSVLKEKQELITSFPSGNHLVFLDKNLIKNICINLLSNAIKYSEDGKKIYFQVECENEALKIQIQDEGIGIPEDEQSHVFNRFFRAHNASNIQGTGLGLNIVKKYIDLLKGEISFESYSGKGTTFFVWIPLPAHVE